MKWKIETSRRWEKATLENLPSGPYYLVSQFEDDLDGVEVEKVNVHFKATNDLKDLRIGYKAYVNDNGKLKKVAYWHDLSD